MPASEIEAFFESKAFKDWQKTQDARLKLDLALINRMDALIRITARRGS